MLQHIAFGLSDKEVAFRLRVSPPTVHKFAGRVNAKLGARNRVEAVVIALPTGAPPAVRVKSGRQTAAARGEHDRLTLRARWSLTLPRVRDG